MPLEAAPCGCAAAASSAISLRLAALHVRNTPRQHDCTKCQNPALPWTGPGEGRKFVKCALPGRCTSYGDAHLRVGLRVGRRVGRRVGLRQPLFTVKATTQATTQPTHIRPCLLLSCELQLWCSSEGGRLIACQAPSTVCFSLLHHSLSQGWRKALHCGMRNMIARQVVGRCASPGCRSARRRLRVAAVGQLDGQLATLGEHVQRLEDVQPRARRHPPLEPWLQASQKEGFRRRSWRGS